MGIDPCKVENITNIGTSVEIEKAFKGRDGGLVGSKQYEHSQLWIVLQYWNTIYVHSPSTISNVQQFSSNVDCPDTRGTKEFDKICI